MKRKKIYILLSMVCLGAIVGYIRYVYIAPISTAQIQNIAKRCKKNTHLQSANCYRREFQRIVRTTNLKEVMVAVVASNTADPSLFLESEIDCHGVSHIIGETAGLLPNVRSSTLISACGSSCGYGCTHGVVMGIVQNNPERINNLEIVCKDPRGAPLSLFDEIACFHGLGHGLAEYTRYNTSDAVARCNRFGTRDAREECMSGVFMEVYSPADRNHPAVPIPKDLFANCLGLRDSALVYCKRMMITALYRSNKEIAPPFRLCHEAVSEKEGECVLTLGADAYFVEQADIPRILNLCRQAGLYFPDCVEGVVSSSIIIHQDVRQASDICIRAGPEVERSCMDYMHYRMRIMGIEVR